MSHQSLPLNGYTRISCLGHGEYATADLHITKSDLEKGRSLLAQGKSEAAAISTAMSNTVVIKRYMDGESQAEERDVLLAIKAQATDSNQGSKLMQLLNYDQTQEDPQYLILSTLPSFCTLQDFFAEMRHLKTPLPIKLVWHLFWEMSAVLSFLHLECDPPIAHGDLHSANILIGFRDSELTGLPTILIIDFDHATTCSPRCEMLRTDVDDFNSIWSYLIDLVKLGAESSGCEVLDKMQNSFYEGKYETIQSVLWDARSRPARSFERLADAEVQEMNGLVRGVVEMNMQGIRKMVLERLRG